MNIEQFALCGFQGIKDDDWLVRGITVLQAMENNVYFVGPNPPLEELQQKEQRCIVVRVPLCAAAG